MNKARRSQIEKIIEVLDVNMNCIEELLAEEQDYFDNMPESFQTAEKGESAESAINNLEMAKDSVQEAIEYLTEALA